MLDFLKKLKLDNNTLLLIVLVVALLIWMNTREAFQSFKYYNGYACDNTLGGLAGFAHPYYGHSPGCTHGGYDLPEKSHI